MIQLNYHHLYYFKTIATEGSISRAAQKLSLGQPTLSMQLKQFEEYLGHELFERKNRSLVLTEVGRLVLGYANDIFRLGGEMLETISDRPTTKRARLHIGALDSVPKALLKELMLRVFKLGEIHLSIVEGEYAKLMSELTEHRLDFVISNSPAPGAADEHLFGRTLSRTPLVIAGAPQFKELSTNFPASLNRKPFILPLPASRVRNEIEHFLDEEHLTVDILIETQDSSLMKAMAQDGHGLMVAAENVLQDCFEQGTLVKIGTLEERFEEIWLIAAHRKMQNPLVTELLKDL